MTPQRPASRSLSSGSDVPRRTVQFQEPLVSACDQSSSLPQTSPPLDVRTSPTSSSAMSRLSLQQRWRHVMSRTGSGPALAVLAGGEGPQTHGPQLPVPLHRLQSYDQHTQPSPPPPPPVLWPKAQEDERAYDAFTEAYRHCKQVMAQHQDEAQIKSTRQRQQAHSAVIEARRAGLLAIGEYQAYLRERTVAVGEDLQEFKARNEVLLRTLIDAQDRAMWQTLNSADVLVTVHKENPFRTAKTDQFIARQKARDEQLSRMLHSHLHAIRQAHPEPLSTVRCKELLALAAHDELVEKDYIQYYLELTVLTRCQLSAIEARRRLSQAAPL